MTNKKIIVDLDVWNCTIRACKPEDQDSPMPVDDLGKMFFWNNVSNERLNKRQSGTLKGKALRKAEKIVDTHGAINMSGIYGSIEIDEKDFVPMEDN
jgi:hypothetical protein